MANGKVFMVQNSLFLLPPPTPTALFLYLLHTGWQCKSLLPFLFFFFFCSSSSLTSIFTPSPRCLNKMYNDHGKLSKVYCWRSADQKCITWKRYMSTNNKMCTFIKWQEFLIKDELMINNYTEICRIRIHNMKNLHSEHLNNIELNTQRVSN